MHHVGGILLLLIIFLLLLASGISLMTPGIENVDYNLQIRNAQAFSTGITMSTAQSMIKIQGSEC